MPAKKYKQALLRNQQLHDSVRYLRKSLWGMTDSLTRLSYNKTKDDFDVKINNSPAVRKQPHSKVINDEKAYAEKTLVAYNLCKYIEWPDSCNVKPRFIIAVVGDKKLYDRLMVKTKGKTAGHRPIELLPYSPAMHPDMVFVSDAEKTRIPAFAQQYAHKPVLLVGESYGLKNKLDVVIYVKDGTIKFHLHQKSIQEKGLSASSTLLYFSSEE